ncbi:PSKH1 [Symbiodinium sp. KB8]|nr:PSKH1 [Symbiodinium sp. KB8]
MTKFPSFLSGMFPASSSSPPAGKRSPHSAGRAPGVPSPRPSAASPAPPPPAWRTQEVAGQAVTKEVLQESIDAVTAGVQSWDPEEYILNSLLQEAVRNHGRVDLMQKKSGEKFAVKRMPNRWVREGPTEFNEQYPTASERPWVDIGLVRHLNSIRYPYVCELIGVFRDDENTYVTVSLATQGDLFTWCDRDPRPGPSREAVMLPIIGQIFTAVRWLHDLGVAHRDLSLENILLTDAEGSQQVKLIDFGMSTTNRVCKKEAFALGVVLFAMAVQDYPWTSTKKNSCQLFEYISTFGLMKFLKKRKLRKGTEHLSEVLSAELAQLIDCMLQLEPGNRLCLGESCFSGEARRTVWDEVWIQPFQGGR